MGELVSAPQILVLNAGSSSIKFAVFEGGASLQKIVAGRVARIGLQDAAFKAAGAAPGDTFSHALDAPDHAGLAQVACFDTAFTHAMPRVATLLPIPRRYAEEGLRRYGFHGLSYEYLMQELARLDGAPAARGRVVLAHLGNGASLAAVHDGKPVDTSMGFTPTGGVPMSTRSGDVDPGLLCYLARTEGLDAGQLNTMLNTQSGLLGVSGTSADMRDLLALEATDVRAAEAVALFCYQVRKWIGAYAAALGGIDTLVFSGGIGENAPEVRSRICAGLGFLGIEIDAPCNAANAAVISAGTGAVMVRVIQTDEERVIARSVGELLGLPFDTELHDDDQECAN